MSKTNTQTQSLETQVVETPKLKYDVDKLNGYRNTSTKIRYLDSCNVSRGEIAKILDKRYQHVRNVLTQPITTAAEQI